MNFRRLLPLAAVVVALSACSADAVTGPTLRAPIHHDASQGSGMMGGGGDLLVDGSGMMGGGG